MNKPLAFRMRPKHIKDVLGQKHLINEQGFLMNCVKANNLVSLIIYGPSGSGKTSLAYALANDLDMNVIFMNAVSTNKAEMIDNITKAKKDYPTLIVMDEIHRLDKAKQDLLLPSLENGDFILIGTTTANPYISINPAIRSRVHILEAKPLSKEDITEGLNRAIESVDGLNNTRKFDKDSLEYIAQISGGDLRFAYNLLEIASLSFTASHTITKEDIKSLKATPNIISDKDEDEHYNTVSGLQKSIRGSEVDAALFYFAKLLEGGDLEGLIRRLLVTAYEDVGLANPQAVDRCLNACEVAMKVGLPEAQIPLGFTVVDLALSPKSKSSCLATEEATDFVLNHPMHVREYLKLHPINQNEEDSYPYDRPDLWEKIEYMPEGYENIKFYIPKDSGKYERALKERYEKLSSYKRETDLASLKKKNK